jgi:hypothetical protein
MRSSGWWSFYWGANRRSNVTDVAIDNMLARMNDEFAYFRDIMGWPPDSRAQRGFRSAIYLFGSGIGCMEGSGVDRFEGSGANLCSYVIENMSHILQGFR